MSTSFAKALELERKIGETRFKIESADSNFMPIELSIHVEKLRRMIAELGPAIDLAVENDTDPMRTEVLRMRENFGRYWNS